jgi:group II intron reverse transcriptase/maturase
MPQTALTSLSHHIDLDWLKEAYGRTRKDGAVGVDGQTALEYEANLKGNLRSLLNRAKSGTYHAPPVRRVHIPKGTGNETRPIGIPTFEDKVLQRAVAMSLEAVYEQDFKDCSYGFRPGRSAHQALQALWTQAMAMGGGWIVEVDIQKFFDTLDHRRLRELLDRRVRDGVLRRLIDKWLKAGVMEDGCLQHPDAGTPQGGVISPLLANVYLHYVLDVWFEEIRPSLQGRAFLIRYADDFVMGLSNERDARAMMSLLRKRFEEFGLKLHPKKTRLIRFRPPGPNRPEPGSFDLLGFTHHWGRSLKGQWIIQRKTASSRLSRALQRLWEWCRGHRHRPLAEQQASLSQKLKGHYGYYGITGNRRWLSYFWHQAQRTWFYWLNRRSQRRSYNWECFGQLLRQHPLPAPIVVHSIYRCRGKPVT